MELLKIKLDELKAFCDTDLFRQFPIKPISPLRVESYLNNPRANGTDFVLYLFILNDEIVAFRSILPDTVLLQGEKIKFGWCSGVWVKPEYRGEKRSTSLLKEIIKDWDGRLMFTNYVGSSERCNLLSGNFELLKERKGFRFYLYPDFNKILSNRKNYSRLKFILPLLSMCVCSISFFKSLFHSQLKNKYVELNKPDHECEHHLRNISDSFFNRKAEEINWIIRYPWVTETSQDDYVYPFSYSKINHRLRIVKVFEKESFAGFFIYTIIDLKMKIPYYFINDDHLHLLIEAVTQIAIKEKVAFLTLLDSRLVSLFRKKNSCFVFSKPFVSNIYSSFGHQNIDDALIFDGDGDNCFT
jgi:hypothetical protein